MFNSGVVKDYQMDSVLELKDAKVEVKSTPSTSVTSSKRRCL